MLGVRCRQCRDPERACVVKRAAGLLLTVRAVARVAVSVTTDTVLGDPCRYQCGARARGLYALERHYYIDHADGK